jgi:hypothetical protein
MNDFPSHISPPYTEEACEDALFHYTTAAGLIGILRSKKLWATAYYCSNDSSELSVGQGVLKPLFRRVTAQMIKDNAPLMHLFASRGVHPMHYADG